MLNGGKCRVAFCIDTSKPCICEEHQHHNLSGSILGLSPVFSHFTFFVQMSTFGCKAVAFPKLLSCENVLPPFYPSRLLLLFPQGTCCELPQVSSSPNILFLFVAKVIGRVSRCFTASSQASLLLAIRNLDLPLIPLSAAGHKGDRCFCYVLKPVTEYIVFFCAGVLQL